MVLIGLQKTIRISILVFFACLTVVGFAQRTVTGTITDDSGVPLIGANVLVQGTATGTVSDLDGTFELSGLTDESVLVFSYTGMQNQTEAVGQRSVINVSLSSAYLAEVVVTALGIEREERSLGYAVGNVDGEDLVKVSQENVLSSISGRVPGVTINQTSGPGSSMSVIIRGATSLTTDNQPLFVVDGVPMSNSLNNIVEQGNGNQVDYGNAISDISPDDIEDITILKGPSAAALYGTRAGNGVILITTKSGSRNKKLGVSLSTSNVFERPTRLLNFHYKYANGERNHTFDEGSAYWGGPELDVGNRAHQWNDAPGEESELRSYPDNMKEFLQTGITSTNNLAISGGSDKGSYRVSFSNMAHRGMIPNSDLHRNSLGTALNFDISKNLTFGANINVAKQNSKDRPSTGDRRGNALQSVYESSYVDVRQLKDYWVPNFEEVQQSGPDNGDNPYFVAYGINNGFVRDRLFGNLSLTYDVTDKLSVTLRHAMDRFNESRETKIPWSYSRMSRGGYFVQDLVYQETNSDILATYKTDAGDFNLVFSAGGNIMKRHANSASTGVNPGNRHNGLVIPGLYTLSNIPSNNIRATQTFSEKSIQSVYALASIGFQNMLYLDLTARNDWSSTLPTNNNSYFYPSASLSWLVNYAFDMPEEVSLFKVRAGWAQVGNDTDPYQLEPTLTRGSYNAVNTISVPAGLLNADLKPELSTSIELGIDLNLWRDRLRFSATYYTVDNENQIFGVNLPRSSGFSSRVINAGLLRSTGWEFALGATPIKSGNGLVWDFNLNLSQNTTTIEELVDGLESLTLWGDNGGGAITKVGDEVGDLYSRGYKKVDDPNSPYYNWPVLAGGGWQRLSDLDDLIKVGNFNPDMLVGLQTSLSYKRFNLAASLDWRIGGEFMSFTYRYGESDWRSSRQLNNLIPGGLLSTDELAAMLKSNPEKYIIPQTGNFPRVGGHTAETGGFPYEGGNDGAFIPGVYVGDDGEYVEHLGGPGTIFGPITDTYPWSFNQQITFDASFIKLRELSLGYQLPKFKGVSDAYISVYTRNLILWTKADIGIDPERAYQANNRTQGDIRAVQFKQGLERQNVMPWTFPLGVKLNLNF